MRKNKIELGDAVHCKITKYRGIVTAITRWLNGCSRVTVQPRKLNKDGSLNEGQCIDEVQLVVDKKHAVPAYDSAGLGPAGPRPIAKALPRVGYPPRSIGRR